MALENAIRTLIVDDEAPARLRIRQLLKDERDFQLIGECSNGKQALAAIEKERPDLVFLDIQMPRLSGLQVCEALREKSPPMIIFVTAYDQYALQAFEVHAVDYLLKPFDRERFQKSLRHAREQLRRDNPLGVDSHLAALLEDLRSSGPRLERLAFKTGGRVIFLRIADIHWVEADRNYIQVHAGEVIHQVRETTAWIEAQLPSDKFMRISRSVIVNLDRIKEIQPLFYGDYVVILEGGKRLTLSRNFRDRLEKLLKRQRSVRT